MSLKVGSRKRAYVDQEACGVRYYGSGFDVIYIGAPIWHMNSEDAKMLGEKIWNLFDGHL